jgi:hypothetical protein
VGTLVYARYGGCNIAIYLHLKKAWQIKQLKDEAHNRKFCADVLALQWI